MTANEQELGPRQFIGRRGGDIVTLVDGSVIAGVPEAKQAAEEAGRELRFDFLDDEAVLEMLHRRHADEEEMFNAGLKHGAPLALVGFGAVVYWGGVAQYWETPASRNAYLAVAAVVLLTQIFFFVRSGIRQWGDPVRQNLRARAAKYRQIAHIARRGGRKSRPTIRTTGPTRSPRRSVPRWTTVNSPEARVQMTTETAETTQRALTGGDGIEVRWIMPEGFFELPFGADDLDELADQLVALAKQALPGADEEVQLQYAAMCAAHYDEFIEAGVQYAGFVNTEVDGVRCTATVNVSLLDLDERAGRNPAGFIASTMRHLGLGQVDEVQLPCGPAVTCVGNRASNVDGALTQSGQDEPIWTSFIQVQIPLTNGTVLVLEMGTPTVEGWDVFSSMFAGIVKSVRLFDESGAPLVMPG